MDREHIPRVTLKCLIFNPTAEGDATVDLTLEGFFYRVVVIINI